MPVPLPTPFRPGDPRHLDPLGLHVRDTTDPHKVRDRLVDIGVLRKNGDGTYSPYLPMKADLVNGKVPASQLPEGGQGVTDVLVDNVSVVTGGTASISLAGKVDKEQGKGLSSNDYTTEEKAKLSGVEAGAQKNVAPVAPSTDASAAGKPADAKATGDQLAGKQATISDLATIRSGAAAGAAAYQKPQTGIPATDLAAAVLTSLGKANTAVQSVNGETPGALGEVEVVASLILSQEYNLSVEAVLQLLDVTKANAADIRYALGETITATAQLADRTGNRVAPEADNAADIVLTFPDAVAGYLRDFLVLVTNTAGNTGSITFTPPTGATVYGDGFTNSPASGETWLYSITEVADNTFWVKSVKMEVAQ